MMDTCWLMCEMGKGAWVNMDKYRELKGKKFVQIKNHPVLPLTLLNYTSKTQLKKKWCPELLQARGLVVNVDGKIIARPLPKFCNDFKLDHIPSGSYEVYEKMDGSLIIMSFYKGKPFFCTRGSFISEQSIKAEEIYQQKYTHQSVDQNYTYCFEIIYPQNKIVVDYGSEEDMFLLAKICTATGEEAPITNTGFRCLEKVYTFESVKDLKKMDKFNKEGFVVKFIEDNFRIKIKFPSYIALHKRPLSRKQVIKMIKSESIPNIPDEGFEELSNQMKQLTLEYKGKDNQLLMELEEILRKSNNEADIVSLIKRSPNKSLMFNMYKNKEYSHLVWDLLK